MKRLTILFASLLLITTFNVSCDQAEDTYNDVIEDLVPATLTLKVNGVEASSSNIINELNAALEIDVETNKADSLIFVSIEDGIKEWCSAIVSNGVITIKTEALNISSLARKGVITVTAGTGSIACSKEFTITQPFTETPVEDEDDTDDIVVFEIDKEAVYLGSESNSSDTIVISTVYSYISVNINDRTNFSAKLDGNNVIVTALSTNNSLYSISATLTITAGPSTRNIIISQESALGVTLGSVYDGGIVYSISDDGTTAMIFSVNQELIAFSDGTINVYGSGIATDNYDGAANTAAILALEGYSSTTFPAFAWCESLGEGWYIPARYELIDVFTYVLGDATGADAEGQVDSGIMATLDAIGAEQFMTDTWYNSSTASEHNTTDGVKNRMTEFQTDTGYSKVNSNHYSSMNARYTRAIKQIKL